MKILILEDEHLVAESLMKLVRQLEPEAVLEGPVVSVTEARQVLARTRPDLIISDIQLADGISLDVFTDGQIECPIIFTTAYNEYAVRAFKVNSIDYLLKPVDRQELQAAFDKFHLMQSKYRNDEYLQQIGALFRDFRSSRKYKDRFMAHLGRNIVLVRTAEIACFAREEVIYLCQPDGRKLITDFRSLDEIEEVLDPALFYRANRQYLISLSAIASMHTEDPGRIVVKLKVPQVPEVVVSKEKAAAFRRWVEGD